MMKKYYLKIMGRVIVLACIMLSACTPSVENPKIINKYPNIYPDYIGVTIPTNIAPLNFNMKGEAVDVVDVVAKGSKGGEIHASGEWADFDVDEWHQLTELLYRLYS